MASPDRADDAGGPATLAAIAVLAAAIARTPNDDTAPHAGAGTPPDRRVPATTRGGIVGKVDLALQRHSVTAFPIGVMKEFSLRRGGRYAALVTYYSFFSLFPAMLALVTVLGFVLEDNESLRQDIRDSAIGQFPIIGDSISDNIHPLGGNLFALVFGLATALWAGIGAMQAVQDGFNDLWGVARAKTPGFLVKRLRSVAMLVVIGLLLIASTAGTQIATQFMPGATTAVFAFAASAAFNIAVFAFAYRLLTVASIGWRDVAPGALVAGIGHSVVQLLGGIYVTRTLNGAEDTYGTFATVIGLLSWIYLIATVTMIGCEVNVVARDRRWPRSLFERPESAAAAARPV
jgi:YihY family inner membrane protein